MKKILVVIDMQNDFIDGALGTVEAQAIVENVIAKINEYDADCVYATRDTHYENYMDTMEGKKLPVPHCIKGTDGWQIRKEIEALLMEKNAPIIDKPTFGSFNLLDSLVEETESDECEFEFVGLCTDICVVSNVMLLKAAIHEATIKVDSSCCAGVTPDTHEAALTTMRMCQIDVI